ncbi:MAG: hypothetical protein KDD22_05015 [Bdellovibrionales bacterium]|nr:hypothetical protein [Bdellovibrionales bacterium]
MNFKEYSSDKDSANLTSMTFATGTGQGFEALLSLNSRSSTTTGGSWFSLKSKVEVTNLGFGSTGLQIVDGAEVDTGMAVSDPPVVQLISESRVGSSGVDEPFIHGIIQSFLVKTVNNLPFDSDILLNCSVHLNSH